MAFGKANWQKEDPDGQLVRQIAAGDSHAAQQLVDRHLGAMVALARHMLNDPVEAEDVAQEVFLKVWIHAAKWKPGAAMFKTWMHRVAINLCYDRLCKKREVYMDVLPELVDEDAIGAEQTIVQRQVALQVETAMGKLAPRQRAALTLCHLQEMGNIEAASIMEISVEALESLLSRGRRALRSILEDQKQELLSK
ncbi:MAG: RNA polymerase sigma-70 factor [Robiginitomaculum sp.]|nr:MAG: RNA polymerase sigma-70 factor [Robiginitomaculum sp.]